MQRSEDREDDCLSLEHDVSVSSSVSECLEEEYSYGESDREFVLASAADTEEEDIEYNIDPIECPICFATVDAGMGIKLPCHHWFCTSCYRRHIHTQVEEGRADRIACPMPKTECGKVLAGQIINEVLDTATKQKMSRYRDSAFVLANPNYHHCPTPDCDNVVFWDRQADVEPIVDCYKCQRVSCAQCGASPFHHGLSCAQHHANQVSLRKRRQLWTTKSTSAESRMDLTRIRSADVSMGQKLQWKRPKFQFKITKGPTSDGGFDVVSSLHGDLDIKRCRRCGNGIELAHGCLKMKCRCGYRFCFRCGSENAQCSCTPGHHGYADNVTGAGDFSGLHEAKSYT